MCLGCCSVFFFCVGKHGKTVGFGKMAKQRHKVTPPENSDMPWKLMVGRWNFHSKWSLCQGRSFIFVGGGDSFSLIFCSYCWWKTSCTTQHAWNPVNNVIFTYIYHINWLAGFLNHQPWVNRRYSYIHSCDFWVRRTRDAPQRIRIERENKLVTGTVICTI